MANEYGTYETGLTNLSYINKDFQAIYPELLDLAKNISYKWDPTISDESDPGVVLLKLCAIIADKNNYNIDQNILECFPSTVSQLYNARPLFQQLGYTMKWYRSAETTVALSWIKSSSNTPKDDDDNTLDVTLSIPRFAMVSNEDQDAVYTLTKSIELSTTGTTITCEAMQGTITTLTLHGNSIITLSDLDSNNRLYFPNYYVAQNGIFILDPHNEDSDEWTQVDNLSIEQLGQKVYKFGVNRKSTNCYIEFPSDINDLIGSGLVIKYLVTTGKTGNVGANVLTQPFSEINSTYSYSGETITLPITSEDILITNPYKSEYGYDPETIEEAYKNYQKTIGTFSTLVSLNDYQNYIGTLDKISNSIVSDRTTDIQSSYHIVTNSDTVMKKILHVDSKLVTLKSIEQFIKNTITATANVNGNYQPQATVNTAEITNLISTQPQMGAFDLKLYALQYVQTPTDALAYNASFDMVTNVDDVVSSTITDIVYNDLDEVKSLQHDFISQIPDKICILKNKYPIVLRIVPQYKLTTLQQQQITENIQTALYSNLYASKCTFGEEMSYSDIYDIVSNADNRIKSVVMDDLVYTTYAVYPEETYKDGVTTVTYKEVAISDGFRDEYVIGKYTREISNLIDESGSLNLDVQSWNRTPEFTESNEDVPEWRYSTTQLICKYDHYLESTTDMEVQMDYDVFKDAVENETVTCPGNLNLGETCKGTYLLVYAKPSSESDYEYRLYNDPDSDFSSYVKLEKKTSDTTDNNLYYKYKLSSGEYEYLDYGITVSVDDGTDYAYTYICFYTPDTVYSNLPITSSEKVITYGIVEYSDKIHEFRNEIYAKCVLNGNTPLYNPDTKFNYSVGQQFTQQIDDIVKMSTYLDTYVGKQCKTTEFTVGSNDPTQSISEASQIFVGGDSQITFKDTPKKGSADTTLTITINFSCDGTEYKKIIVTGDANSTTVKTISYHINDEESVKVYDNGWTDDKYKTILIKYSEISSWYSLKELEESKPKSKWSWIWNNANTISIVRRDNILDFYCFDSSWKSDLPLIFKPQSSRLIITYKYTSSTDSTEITETYEFLDFGGENFYKYKQTTTDTSTSHTYQLDPSVSIVTAEYKNLISSASESTVTNNTYRVEESTYIHIEDTKGIIGKEGTTVTISLTTVGFVPQTTLDNAVNVKECEYAIRENENIQLAAPKTVVTDTYGSGVLIQAQLPVIQTIPAESEYTLRDGESVTLYWMEEENSQYYTYHKYVAGDIVGATFDVVSWDSVKNATSTNIGYCGDTLLSGLGVISDSSTLGTLTKISSLSTSSLQTALGVQDQFREYSIDSVVVTDATQNCYWITNKNADGEYVLFEENQTEHILTDSECFVYVLEGSTVISILQSGTKISRYSTSETENPYPKWAITPNTDITMDKIVQQQVEAFYYENWFSIPGNEVTVTATKMRQTLLGSDITFYVHPTKLETCYDVYTQKVTKDQTTTTYTTNSTLMYPFYVYKTTNSGSEYWPVHSTYESGIGSDELINHSITHDYAQVEYAYYSAEDNSTEYLPYLDLGSTHDTWTVTTLLTVNVILNTNQWLLNNQYIDIWINGADDKQTIVGSKWDSPNVILNFDQDVGKLYGQNVSTITYDSYGNEQLLTLYQFELSEKSESKIDYSYAITSEEAVINLKHTITTRWENRSSNPNEGDQCYKEYRGNYQFYEFQQVTGGESKWVEIKNVQVTTEKFQFSLKSGTYLLPIVVSSLKNASSNSVVYMYVDDSASPALSVGNSNPDLTKHDKSYIDMEFEIDEEAETVSSKTIQFVANIIPNVNYQIKIKAPYRYKKNFATGRNTYNITEKEFEEIKSKVIELDTDSVFDYVYEVDPDDKISFPLQAIEFFTSTHPYNKYTIGQMNTYDSDILVTNKIK